MAARPASLGEAGVRFCPGPHNMERPRTFTTTQMAKAIEATLREKRKKVNASERLRYPLEAWTVAQVLVAGRLIREKAGTYVRRAGIPVQYDPDPVFRQLNEFSADQGRRGLHFRRMGLGNPEINAARKRLLSEPH